MLTNPLLLNISQDILGIQATRVYPIAQPVIKVIKNPDNPIKPSVDQRGLLQGYYQGYHKNEYINIHERDASYTHPKLSEGLVQMCVCITDITFFLDNPE